MLRAGRILAIAAAVALVLGAACRGADNSRDEALRLLRECLHTQSQTDRISCRILADRDIPETGDGWPRHQVAETYIRRDGDRLDVAQKYLFPDDPKFKERSHRWRAVTTREMGVMYYAGIDSATPAKGIVDNDWSDWFTRHGINHETTGGPLDGYVMPSGTRRAAELMIEASDLRVRGSETIASVPCRVVEATSRHGTYRLWIAESKGYLPLKMTYAIGPDQFHEYDDDRPFSQITISTPDGKKHAGRASSGILEDVVVEKIGDTHVPIAGKFTRTEWYGEIRLLAANTYARTETDLRPQFDGTDAFSIDLPEGAYLTNMADQTSGVVYQWREGKALPGGIDFEGERAEGSFGNRPLLTQIFLGIAGIVMFGAGLAMAWTVGSNQQTSVRGKG